SLILEEGTLFYQLYETGKQASLLPDEDTERRMYEMTEDYLKRIGLYRYEISNYARPGYECRHNSSYWQRIPYLGLGLGASSFWGEVRWKNQEDLEKYLQSMTYTDNEED
ncbi:MAG: coproporphyrinogen III oxidase, partial [Lachnospiraceae bacterium]|nr:coproporphyrinogen III oxidase [Lachnospiraceae bacterium]